MHPHYCGSAPARRRYGLRFSPGAVDYWMTPSNLHLLRTEGCTREIVRLVRSTSNPYVWSTQRCGAQSPKSSVGVRSLSAVAMLYSLEMVKPSAWYNVEVPIWAVVMVVTPFFYFVDVVLGFGKWWSVFRLDRVVGGLLAEGRHQVVDVLDSGEYAAVVAELELTVLQAVYSDLTGARPVHPEVSASVVSGIEPGALQSFDGICDTLRHTVLSLGGLLGGLACGSACGLLGGFLLGLFGSLACGLFGSGFLSGILAGGLEPLHEAVVLGVQLLDVLELPTVVGVNLLGESAVGLLQVCLGLVLSGEEFECKSGSHDGSFLLG